MNLFTTFANFSTGCISRVKACPAAPPASGWSELSVGRVRLYTIHRRIELALEAALNEPR